MVANVLNLISDRLDLLTRRRDWRENGTNSWKIATDICNVEEKCHLILYAPLCFEIDAIIIQSMTTAQMVWTSNANTDCIDVDGISKSDLLNISTTLDIQHAIQPGNEQIRTARSNTIWQ